MQSLSQAELFSQVTPTSICCDSSSGCFSQKSNFLRNFSNCSSRTICSRASSSHWLRIQTRAARLNTDSAASRTTQRSPSLVNASDLTRRIDLLRNSFCNMNISTTSGTGSKMKFKLCSSTTPRKRPLRCTRQSTGTITEKLRLTRSSPSRLPTLSTRISFASTIRASHRLNVTSAHRPGRNGRSCLMKLSRLSVASDRMTASKTASKSNPAHCRRRVRMNTYRKKTSCSTSTVTLLLRTRHRLATIRLSAGSTAT